MDEDNGQKRTRRSKRRFKGAESRYRSKQKEQKVAIDFHKWEMCALKKYRKHFNLEKDRSSIPKVELLEIVKKHFNNQQSIDEHDTISSFLFANRKHCRENVLF